MPAIISIAVSLVLGQLTRLELFDGMVAIYPHDIVLFFVSLYWIWTWVPKMRSIAQQRLFVPGVLCLSWIIGQTVFKLGSDLESLAVATAYSARLCAIGVYGIALYFWISEKQLRHRFVTLVFLYVPFLIAVFGLLQYVFVPDTRDLVYLGWDDHYYRLIGTLFDPAFTGMLLVLGFFFQQKYVKNKILRSALSFVLLIALALTYSRASYLAFLIGCFFLILKERNWRAGIFGLILLLGLPLLPRPGGEGVRLERSASVIARLENTRGILTSLTISDWITGVGLYANKSTQGKTVRFGTKIPNHAVSADNSFLFFLSSVGVIGTVLALWVLYQFFVAIDWQRDVLLFLIVTGVHALFCNTFFHPFILIYLVSIMAQTLQKSPVSSRLQQG